MIWLLLSISFSTPVQALQQGEREDVNSVLIRAIRAVEGDSSASVAASWERRLARDSMDAAATLGLATLARQRYDYATSDSNYLRLIRRDRRNRDPYAIAARVELGRSLQVRGLNDSADSLYTAAIAGAARVGSRSLEVGALVSLASVRTRTLGPAAGDSLLRLAESRLPTGDWLTLSEFYCARAALLHMTGSLNAELEARRGSEFAEQSEIKRQRAQCMRVLAVLMIDRDRREEGFALLEEVVDRLSAIHDRAALSGILQWRGYQFYVSYDYGRARQDLLRAVDDGIASGAVSPVAWALLTLTMLSSSAGDIVSARDYADRAAQHFEWQGDQWGLSTLRAIQGQVEYQAGDHDNARAHLGDALKAAESIGHTSSIVAVRTGLALLEMDDGNLEVADRHLQSARNAAVNNRLTGWERGLSPHFARLAILRGELDAAERQLRGALGGGTLTDSDQPAVVYQLRSRLADVLMKQGRAQDAGTELRLAIDALDSVRSGLSDQELRALVLQNLRDARDPALGAPQVIAGLVLNGRVDEAFTLADRRKAGHLLDKVVLRDLFKGDEVAGRTTPKSNLQHLSRVTMAEVSGALPRRTALLEYVTGASGAPTTLFVVDKSGGSAFVLTPLDSITTDLRRFNTLIEEGRKPDHLARTLAAALLDKAIGRLPRDVDRLVVVPDAGLSRVPVDALVLSDGRRMVERFSISVAPSAGVAVQLWKRPVNSAPVELLALGDPDFGSSGVALGSTDPDARALATRGALERLPYSGRESRMVARYAPSSTVRLGKNASESFIKETGLRRYRVVHLAAHALVDEQTPMRTALVLSPASDNDGLLRGRDLAALDLDADLVMLSACSTGSGTDVHGEGVEGLTGPLLEAGARGVVASLWRVDDRTTAEFVQTFYDALADGHPTGTALTIAKRNAMARGEPPAVWAAFTLVGDPDVTIPLNRHNSPVGLWVVISVLAALTAYGVFTRKSRSTDRLRVPSESIASTHQLTNPGDP